MNNDISSGVLTPAGVKNEKDGAYTLGNVSMRAQDHGIQQISVIKKQMTKNTNMSNQEIQTEFNNDDLEVEDQTLIFANLAKNSE